jgi:hypothetical protein
LIELIKISIIALLIVGAVLWAAEPTEHRLILPIEKYKPCE